MMKVLCDVHIAFKIIKFFEAKRVETVHVNNILEEIVVLIRILPPMQMNMGILF